jgi:hypothetical protein
LGKKTITILSYNLIHNTMRWTLEGALDDNPLNSQLGIAIRLKDEGADADTASLSIHYGSYTTTLITPSGIRKQIFSIEEVDEVLLADDLEPIPEGVRFKVGSILRSIAEDRKEYA